MFKSSSNYQSKISRSDFLKVMAGAGAAMTFGKLHMISSTAQLTDTTTNNNFVPNYSVIVFQKGDKIIAMNYQGTTIASGFLGIDDSNVIQRAIDYLSASSSKDGSGVLFINQGTYEVMNIVPKSNIHMRFNKSAIFKRSGPASASIFDHQKQPVGLNNFILEGGTFLGGSIWYSDGNISYCKFLNNRFFGDPAVHAFLVFFDAFATNPYNVISGNLFSGRTGGDDMLGSGHLNHCEISFNRFEHGDAQGWGAANVNFTRCIGNEFDNVGNTVGMEGNCQGNIVLGNLSYRSGNLKLAEEGSSTSNISRWNIVQSNCLAYSGAIEDGQGYHDIIQGNTIIRSKAEGIFGSFDHCTISDNMIFESNWSDTTINVGGRLYNKSGIALLNNNNAIPKPKATKIQNNTIYTSRTNWTHPDGSIKQGYNGGILIDSTYNSTIIENNVIDNVYGDAVIHLGNNPIIRNNLEYPTDTFKASSISTSIGTGNAYGASTSLLSASGMITFFNEKITIDGKFAENEKITVKTELVYSDETISFLENSFNSIGSHYLTNDELLSLWKNQATIRKINIYAKSTAVPFTGVTVTIDIFGSG
jgi:hypothetical protein